MSAHTVAIIGLGPKGLYCLERLCAEYAAYAPDGSLVVHIFDREKCSPIYDTDQPDHILVNVAVGEIDLWDATDPPPAAGRGPSFMEWYGAPLTGNEYLPRAVVGRYLRDCLHRIIDHAPPGMTIVHHAQEVTDIENGRLEPSSIHADKILLATGHQRRGADVSSAWPRDSAADAAHERTRRPLPSVFIPFVYPVKEMMRPVPAGSRVAMLGIGLTFIDAVLELTEGRGGRFEAETYVRSGGEPAVIYPYSRTGLPMTPKPNALPPPRPLHFVTDEALAELRRRGPVDFERDVIPLIDRELEGFDWRTAINPAVDDVTRYMEEAIASAKREVTPISLWYEIRTALNNVLSFGGFTPESHRALIDEYFPRFKRVVFGPPVINAEKILALTKAGIIDFRYSRAPRIDDVDVLIDARFPKTDITTDPSPLYRNLCRRGTIRPFRNGDYAPGAIDMTPGTHCVIGADGAVDENIAVIGIPTEGNFVGNLTIGRDPFAARWAREVVLSLRPRALGPRPQQSTVLSEA
ncbi:MAG TPA: FAD/NAD(P)-binding protein [Thermoanaerobaculia bacterium]|nr:FAD/NAD(P)-binding protein [Thermoanaerobaculia bacterium]